MEYITPYSVSAVFILVMLILSMRRGSFGSYTFALNSLMVWLTLGLILAVLYSYSDAAKRVAGNVMAQMNPSRAQVEGNQLIYYKGIDGHFHMDVMVNSKKLNFMVDTGASDVVISLNDAKAVGIDTETLNYNQIYRTANGTVKAALVRVDLQIEDIVFQDFEIAVNQGEMKSSLLGMSLLSQFAEVNFEGKKLTLTTKGSYR